MSTMMTLKSDFPDLDIPKLNVLDYLFPDGEPVSEQPVWYDAKNPKMNLSPKQMLQWIKRLCLGLDRLEIGRGDVCMLLSPNNIFIPAVCLGIVGSGRCFSAANPTYTVNEISHQIKNTVAKCILAHPSLVKNAVAAAQELGLPKEMIFQFDDHKCSTQDGVMDWTAMLGDPAEADKYRWRKLSPDESMSTVATINYSSGTTGLPKGVCISHHAMIANVEQTIFMRWYPGLKKGDKPEERWVGFLPLYHAYGQLYVNLMATKVGIPVYVMKSFIYQDFLQHIQDYKITHLQVAPPILVMMNKRPETSKYDLSSLKGILCGAAPLAKDLQNAVQRDFNVDIKQGWGMSEVTCGSLLQLDPATDGNVGKLLPNTECKLLDDDGKDVGYNTPGELYIRAPNVCLRYWKNKEATKEALSPDGWLKTGDVAVVNEKHLFYIVDRKKEVKSRPPDAQVVVVRHKLIFVHS